MQRHVVTVREDLPLSDLCDVFQQEHIHGAPVVDESGALIGFVSQEDVLFGMMGTSLAGAGTPDAGGPAVRDVMTSPAVFATEETKFVDVCRLMWQLRIHHVPIARQGRVTGIISSLDLCRVITSGETEV